MTTASPRSSSKRAEGESRVITLLTDFGERDGFVAIVRGVMLAAVRNVTIVDLTHDVSPQDVIGGALVLASAVSYFPRGTVHLAVVDPGVGGDRRPILVVTDAFALVGPDNGLLSLAAAKGTNPKSFHLDRPEFFRPEPSVTFQARDVFAPVAAEVVRGRAPSELGSPIDDVVQLELPRPKRIEGLLEGQVIHIDRFGNLITNVEPHDVADFRVPNLSVSINGVQIPAFSTHYASVREGKPLALWNSWGCLEIAVRNDSAARHLRARVGDRVKLEARR